MKHIIKKLVSATIVGTAVFLIACSDWTEPEIKVIQNLTEPNIEKDETYWKNLRAYKKSDHALAFGWFGFWNGGTTKTSGALRNAPDSMDIISIWGPSKYSLSKEQIEDMRYVQRVKGTRVTFTNFFHKINNFLPGCGWEETVENIPRLARAMADTISKYNYDGIDLDQESSPGEIFYNADNMAMFMKELRQLIGPDKLIIVDGNISRLNVEGAQYVDYAISQAYSTSSPSSLQSRYGGASHLYKAEQLIVTENFESYWANGGVTYTDEERNKMPSLLGMAKWNPNMYDESNKEIVGSKLRKGGMGAYHMEYECAHDPDYKFMRQAIQIQNPAGTVPVGSGPIVEEKIEE